MAMIASPGILRFGLTCAAYALAACQPAALAHHASLSLKPSPGLEIPEQSWQSIAEQTQMPSPFIASPSMATPEQDRQPAAEQTPAPAPSIASPSELLAGIPAGDLALIQTEAKHFYVKHWPVVADRSRYVRDRMQPVFEAFHAPAGLYVVPIVESGYNSYAFSHAGAMGLWQLMPGTARVLGMRVPRGLNARRDVESSTEGALRYLLGMKKRFGSWPLAFAAYHRGPGSIARAIRRHPWQPEDGLRRMPVPSVTRAYVRHILGLAALFHRHVLDFPDPYPTRQIDLSGPVDLTLLAKASGIELKELFRFNPHLNHRQYFRSTLALSVPDSMSAALLAHMDEAAPALIRIRIRHGDNLWDLAHRYRTTIHFIKRINPGMKRIMRPGQMLYVPATRFNDAAPLPNPLLARGRRIHYRVRSGDSLWKIAKRFGTTPRTIARANSLRESSILRPGDTLWILARIRPS